MVTKWLRKMEQRAMVLLYLVAFCGTLQLCFSFSSDQLQKMENVTDQMGSSVILPVSGNVYPEGYYYVTITVGNNPPSTYFLDIDTGSDVTWLQCDAPCTSCYPAPHALYNPSNDIVKCNDSYCVLFHLPKDVPCESPEDQCDYEIEYADHGSSLGVLVRDLLPLKLTNGTTIIPRLAFGCGYDQEFDDPPYVDGVLGLGNGKATILAQLSELGLMQNMFGHCFSAQGGGYLFMGDNNLPSSEIVWAPMSSDSSENHYSLGPAELRFDGQATTVEGLSVIVILDSGSTYTYFCSPDYEALLNVLRNNAKENQLEDATDDKALPVCWKGPEPFKTIQDVKHLFIPLVLSFTKSSNVQLQLPPEAYLIISDRGNVCLGILNDPGLGLEDSIIIGDISMQDRMVIYDNEKQQIGWLTVDCNSIPTSS